MRIAITGSRGQLGSALQTVMNEHDLMLIDLPDHDITNLSATRAALTAFQPEIIMHTAAITNVDGCETDPDLAYRVNALGTRNLAVSAYELGASLVYISTDYVFDGTKNEPYWEYDTPNPLSVYARTKWLGEQIVRDLLTQFYIVRVAWLYGDGPRNFPNLVIRLAKERGELTMVTDEIGSPTYALDVAGALQSLISQPAYGIYHLPNAGACSRFDWAVEILRLAGLQSIPVHPSTNYERLANVPKHSEMRNFCGSEIGITMRPWQQALAEYLASLRGDADD